MHMPIHITYTPADIAEMRAADVIMATFPEGDHLILKGDDLLKLIADSGKAMETRIMRVPCRNTTEAEILAAVLQVYCQERGH
ncbi:hypothetical protein M0638_12680 [Roseomonas sp. NAR14]|uniref:Uncharacterized protein n=1 Tax=Roseomonas acroporae TaxID=2937791 RepID=A0A9X1Y852_9PROT|nr:hypothetical protein [Roseomonas acroporae]MCK8785241.1 hypothetical protein [Roseomonas acroporae]